MKTTIKGILLTAVLTAATVAAAMPTQQELKAEQAKVNALTRKCRARFSSGQITADQVGDEAVGIAEKEHKEAVKYLLYKGAVFHYLKAQEYLKAADTIGKMDEEIKNLDPEVVVKMLKNGNYRGKDADKINETYSRFKEESELPAEQRGMKQKITINVDEKGKTAPLKFIKCPAGEFEMGCFCDIGEAFQLPNASEPHRVKITRPFYLMEMPVTYAQRDAIFGEENYGYRPSDTNRFMNLAAFTAGDAAALGDFDRKWEMMLRKLTRMNADKLPEGYVFRLPTAAEWEYALKANGENAKHPEMAAYDQHPFKLESLEKVAAVTYEGIPAINNGKGIGPWEVPTIKVGTKTPNAWGFYDLLGNGAEQVLDTVFRIERNVTEPIKYPRETAIDPVSIAKGDPSAKFGRTYLTRGRINSLRHTKCSNFASFEADGRHRTIRLAIGPDLLAERENAAK